MLSRAAYWPGSVFASGRFATVARILADASTRRPLVHYQALVAPTRLASSLGSGSSTSPYQGHQHGSDAEFVSVLPGLVGSIRSCPGCGAGAQDSLPNVPGYYSPHRRDVKRYIDASARRQSLSDRGAHEIGFLDGASQDSDIPAAEWRALEQSISDDAGKELSVPLCGRCHDLLHHHVPSELSSPHPSMASIQDTLALSPRAKNHIYHVIDAADFPMSLIPSIHRIVSAHQLRSKNRRAKTSTYRHGRKTELSIIITRADLLAPRKEQVDRLMPYLTQVLRDALGSAARGKRLGIVRCVSAHRGWWTKEVKSDIWSRGGAGWMLGKANVGKSNLFETVFPKGSGPGVDMESERRKANLSREHARQHDTLSNVMEEEEGLHEASSLSRKDEAGYLPPARQTSYPVMPTVSSLPGTTIAPIRIPFGNGRGELIDLPGLERGGLEHFVAPESRRQLVMKSRVAPEQYILWPGQSLVLGGLIRISPRTTELSILAYPFVPLKAVIRSDRKLLGEKDNEAEHDPDAAPSAQSIALDKTGENLKSAGIFALKWDTTKERAGPLTRRDAVGLKATNLPFKVLSTDILIEGVGWVELVVQVRRKDYPDDAPDSLHEGRSLDFPEVEVFSPEGKFIGSRRPMGGWNLGKPLRKKPKKRMTIFSKLNDKKRNSRRRSKE